MTADCDGDMRYMSDHMSFFGNVTMVALLAGTVTRSPLRYLPYFPYRPLRPTKLGYATVFAVAAVAAFLYSQNQLAAQLANLTL